MKKSDSDILSHFENFDKIYANKQRSLLYRIVDVLFRKNLLQRRLKLFLGFSGDVEGKSILDIGCGPGRYSVLLAKHRPNFVLGIDLSPLMIEIARKRAELNNVADICRFERCDFMQERFDKKFDIIITAGLFDYIADYRTCLLKIKSLIGEKAMISFPVKCNIFTPIRMAWLYKRGCPTYYYSRNEIKKLFKECGLKIDLIHKMGSFLVPGNYLVVCRT